MVFPLIGAALVVLLIANKKKKPGPASTATGPAPVKASTPRTTKGGSVKAPVKSGPVKTSASTVRPVSGSGTKKVEGAGVRTESMNTVFDSGYGPDPNVFASPVTVGGTTYTHIPYKK